MITQGSHPDRKHPLDLAELRTVAELAPIDFQLLAATEGGKLFWLMIHLVPHLSVHQPSSGRGG